MYFIIPAGGGENALNWYGARQVCKANGADLISINSKDMSDTLYKWVRKFVCLKLMSKCKCWYLQTIAIVCMKWLSDI